MHYAGPLTLRNPLTRFDVPGDKRMFDAIVSDMMRNGGELAPSDHWNWNLGQGQDGEQQTQSSGYTDELFESKYSRLDMMLNPWVGVTGMKPLETSAVDKYENFLRAVDHLGLLAEDTMKQGLANGWRETDLGSVMDLNLIGAFLGTCSGRLSICEVGGGYGRLAEAVLGGIKNVHYVLIDAVPGSLMYAYLYLKAQLPDRRIGSYYNGDVYDSEFDCYILPAWYSTQLPDAVFDLSINIESMQEMAQHHADYYLGLFERITRPGGEIYLSNARDYVFKGEWKIPAAWETLYLNNTPRSWSADHPTHILRKGDGDFSVTRGMLEAAFQQQVKAWRQSQVIAEQQKHIADRDRICGELKAEVVRLETQMAMSVSGMTEPKMKDGFFTRIGRAIDRAAR